NLHEPDLGMEVEKTGKLNPDLEVYAYPGDYQAPDKGQAIAKARLEALQAHRSFGSGTSDSARLTAGHTFDLFGHPRQEFDACYRVIQVSHRGSQPQVLDQDAAGEFDAWLRLAFRFKARGGQAAYFDAKGRPTRRTMLRSPLAFHALAPGARAMMPPSV